MVYVMERKAAETFYLSYIVTSSFVWNFGNKSNIFAVKLLRHL